MHRRMAELPIYFLVLLLLFAVGAQAKEPDKSDVRVLIDISGSMKKNDPQNLRRPALRMLVGLMQPGTQASVWTFAKWSNRLVHQSDVNDAWKKKAIALSHKISSPGQFTDVEEILKQASKDWKKPSSTHHRHLVLLTDGMVDVSKVAGESEASRQRIIDKLLPQLKQTGAKIHAIALSDNADHDLMKILSGETGGWYEKIDSADQLQRVFLRIFEKVGKPDSVPLTDNKFTVDSSIDEATVLLFKKEGTPDTVLISPTGQEFLDNDIVAGVAWYRDQGYELITISSPEKGEWALRADVDPDNRVMIVTDLKLVASEMPSHLAVGETIPVSTNLTSRGKVVKRKAFLRLLDVRADALTPAGSDPQLLNDNGEHGDKAAGDGVYSMDYQESRAFDEVELLMSVESATFMREKRHRLAVHEPASHEFISNDDKVTVALGISEAAMQEGATLELWQQPDGAEKQALTLTPDPQNKYRYSVELQSPEHPIHYLVEGMSKSANLIQRSYGPFYAPGQEPVPEPVVDEPVVEAEAPVEESVEEAVVEEEAEDDSMMMAIVIGGANLLLILGGLGIWWFLRKRANTDDDVVLVDDEESEDELGEDIDEDDDEDELAEASDDSDEESDGKEEAA